MIVFVILGRLSHGLSISKLLPILECNLVSEVYIFSNKSHLVHKKAKYILLPKILNGSNFGIRITRIIYEFFQILFYTCKIKPYLINGVFTIPKGYYSFIISKLCGVKNVISILGNINEIDAWIRYTKIVKRLHVWIYKNTDLITTKGLPISTHLIKNGIDSKKIFVFNGAIDTRRFMPLSEERPIDILFVGDFSELKGPDRVISIIQNLKKNFNNIYGVLLGNGKMYSFIKAQVAELNLKTNVQLPGYVLNTQKYFIKAKLLVMPSRSEGLSTAMLESMACGCVPVVSNVGAMTEAAKHNYNSLIVDNYNDTKQFYIYSKELLENSKMRNSLSRNAVKTVMENYSLTTQADIFKNILNHLRKV